MRVTTTAYPRHSPPTPPTWPPFDQAGRDQGPGRAIECRCRASVVVAGSSYERDTTRGRGRSGRVLLGRRDAPRITPTGLSRRRSAMPTPKADKVTLSNQGEPSRHPNPTLSRPGEARIWTLVTPRELRMGERLAAPRRPVRTFPPSTSLDASGSGTTMGCGSSFGGSGSTSCPPAANMRSPACSCH
jgi:hypothetical protein